jgi:predicted secreted protein
MVTAAESSFGVTLTRAGNLIGELTEIGGVKLTMDTEEVTSHESAGSFVEQVGTVLKMDKVPIKGNFLPGDTLGQIGLKTDMEAKTLQDFVITFPPSMGATWTFKALVTDWEIGPMPVDKTMTFEAELSPSGQPALAVTASAGLTGAFFVVTTGTIIPAAANAVYNYVVDIATGETSVTITPTAAAGVITITANGASQVVTSGAPSSAITLGAAGSVTECTIVVQETGKTAKTYTLHLARA